METHGQARVQLLAERWCFCEKKFKGLTGDFQNLLLKGAKVYEDTLMIEFEKTELAYLKTIKDYGVTVIEPDNDAFRRVVKDVPYKFEDKWGKGLYDRVIKAQE